MSPHDPGSAPVPALSQPSATGLRAQLKHLIPRHALFHVRITIHQLASVPLVHGEFGVRWKFKNVHNSPKPPADKARGKGTANAAPEGDADSFGSNDTSTEEQPHPPSMLSVPSEHQHTPSSSSSLFDDAAPSTTGARGQTPWQPLRDHSVSWEHPLDAVVQMSIERDSTHHLHPHPFKLVVMQRVIANDPNTPHNPRLGAVYLDLAEYASSSSTPDAKGLVTRRYLLRDSKTNATLKLSINITPLPPSGHGSPPEYNAPPLPHGEILSGITSFLSAHDDVFRTRPNALNLYAPPPPPPPPPASKRPKQPQPAPFDVRALPLAYGPRPTESLIDALFNPVAVRDERLRGPFTRFVPPGDTPSASLPSLASAPSAAASSSRPSVSSSTSFAPSVSAQSFASASSSPARSIAPSLSHDSSAASLYTSASSSAHGHSSLGAEAHAPHQHWWQRSRSRSRPGTPVGIAA
ncbi:N-terminal C2 in EEIG1 and EHBP1 proteins-domain-containing protein [Mycena sp. CBHHK59/15]|nr:N-terminal C2 in EEIG1 and EHBP1 proteins-domain-containing protein [Mycena sp. CBHHK59/15]